MQDLVGGQIDLMFADQTTSLPQIRTGNIKAYAVTGNRPLAAAPDIPTVDEAGLPGFYCSVWSALFAPKGTSMDIIAKLNAAAVVRSPELRYASGWPSSDSRSFRAKSKHPKRSPPCNGPRSKSGGRSSGRPASGQIRRARCTGYRRPLSRALA
jgi:hypothetical protein